MNRINSFSSFDDGRKLISFCPVCKNEKNFSKPKIIEDREESILLYIKCLNCRGGIVVNVMDNNLGSSSVGIVTDLQEEDALYFRDKKNINKDDILDAYKLLQNNKILVEEFKNKNFN